MLGAAGSLVQAHQDAAAGLADGAVEDVLAVLAEHLFGGHAEEFFGRRLTPVTRNSGSYRTRASESWSKTDSSTLVSLPAWSEFGHDSLGACTADYSKAVCANYPNCSALWRGIAPTYAGNRSASALECKEIGRGDAIATSWIGGIMSQFKIIVPAAILLGGFLALSTASYRQAGIYQADQEGLRLLPCGRR